MKNIFVNIWLKNALYSLVMMLLIQFFLVVCDIFAPSWVLADYFLTGERYGLYTFSNLLALIPIIVAGFVLAFLASPANYRQTLAFGGVLNAAYLVLLVVTALRDNSWQLLFSWSYWLMFLAVFVGPVVYRVLFNMRKKAKAN